MALFRLRGGLREQHMPAFADESLGMVTQRSVEFELTSNGPVEPRVVDLIRRLNRGNIDGLCLELLVDEEGRITARVVQLTHGAPTLLPVPSAEQP